MHRLTHPGRRWSPVLALPIVAVLVLPLAAAAQTAQPAPPACPYPIQPVPSGVTDRPNVIFDSYPDYNWVHSSTHLQGHRATEKFAPGLLWNPPAPAELSGFRSVVVVNNPDPALATTVTVDFYDEGGLLVGSSTFTLAPDASLNVPASPLAAGTPAGRGSARVTATRPITGATVHHTLSVDLSAFEGPVVTDPDPFMPGATSMQQLQAAPADNVLELAMGPMVTSNQASIDFLNGNAPLVWVSNPHPTPTTVNILVLSRLGTNLGTATITLPAYASTLDLRLWNAVWPVYLGPPVVFDDDFLVYVTADKPVLGELVMVDLYSGTGVDGEPQQLGGRFRMASTMLSHSPTLAVVNPELTYQPTNLGIQTLMGILNAGTGDVGPVRIQYFDRDGAALGTDTIASLPRGAMARLGPGLPATPNYPAGPVFDGWVRISGCAAGLVGWTVRTAGDEPNASAPPFKKAWGEVLDGANGNEPGDGFKVTVAGSETVRKVSPLVRFDPSWYWPGYTTFLNDSVANVGRYFYRFFDFPGTDVTLYAGQPFAGLRYGATSFTFEDPYVDGSLVFGATNGSGRVDHAKGKVRGIDVIGDPMVEWGIFDEPTQQPFE